MQYDFIAVGDVTTDSFIKLKMGVHLDPPHDGNPRSVCLNFGEKIEYEEVKVIHGVGNAANAAVSAQYLGLNAALVTDIGTDPLGDENLAVWQKAGVATEYVHRHAEYPTHHHYVLSFGPERTILIKHQPWPYKLPAFAELPKWMYFTSTGAHGESYHHEIADYVKQSGVKLAFQPGTFQIGFGLDKIRDLYEVTELFFCNKEEAQKILGSKEEDIVALARAILTVGPKMASVTDGPNGACAVNSEGAWTIPMYPDPAPPVNRTGAGDAYASTVTSMLARGMSLADALVRGPINSMNVVQHVGAQTGLLKLAQVEELLKNASPNYVLTKVG